MMIKCSCNQLIPNNLKLWFYYYCCISLCQEISHPNNNNKIMILLWLFRLDVKGNSGLQQKDQSNDLGFTWWHKWTFISGMYFVSCANGLQKLWLYLSCKLILVGSSIFQLNIPILGMVLLHGLCVLLG